MRRLTTIIVGLLVALGGLTQAPLSHAAVPYLTVDSGSICMDVVFIGARGSGQAPEDMGAQVESFKSMWLEAMAPRRVGTYNVVYPAQSVELLKRGAIGEFLSGIDDGVAAVLSFMRVRSVMCPSEHYVMAGYSQGAMVIDRAVHRAVAEGVNSRRIDYVMLIANGDRTALPIYPEVGTARKIAGIIYVTPAWLLNGNMRYPATGDSPASSPGDDLLTRSASFCDRSDPVCEIKKSNISKMTDSDIQVHESHYTGTATLRRLAMEAANFSSSRQASLPFSAGWTPVAGIVGVPYKNQILVQNGVSPYSFRVIGGSMPSGLTVSASGEVSGIPEAEGEREVDFRVLDANGQGVTVSATFSIARPIITKWNESIAVGSSNACAIRGAGVRCIGSGFWQGNEWDPVAGVYRPIPTDFMFADEVATVTGLGNTYCSLLRSGAAYCWGDGVGRTVEGESVRSDVPVRVDISEEVDNLSTNGDTTCAVGRSGTLYCWGRGELGLLGNGAYDFAPSPTPVTLPASANDVIVGSEYVCSSLTDGRVFCWGMGWNGQLGNGADEWIATPVQALNIDSARMMMGVESPCAVVTGGIKCWGASWWRSVTPVAANEPIFAVSPTSSPLAFVSSSGTHSCAIDSNFETYCVGDGTKGQLGNGSMSYSDTPVKVSGGLAFTEVRSSNWQTCGRTSVRSVYCWGYGYAQWPSPGYNEPELSELLSG